MCPDSPPIDVHRVIVEVVHVDDGYVAVRPIEPAEEETRTDADSDTPGETHPESWTVEIAGPGSPIDRWVRRPPPRPIYLHRVIVGNIDHLRIRWFDHDGLPLLVHADLVVRFEIAGIRGLLTQTLNCVHYFLLLDQKRIAESLHPVQLLVHHHEDLWKCDERLDAGVPRILRNRMHRLVALEVGIGLGPTSGL